MKNSILTLLTIALIIFVEVNCDTDSGTDSGTENPNDPSKKDSSASSKGSSSDDETTPLNTTGLDKDEIERAQTLKPIPKYHPKPTDFQADFLDPPQYGHPGDITANGRNGEPDPDNTQFHFNVLEAFTGTSASFKFNLFGKTYIKNKLTIIIVMIFANSRLRSRLRLRNLDDNRTKCTAKNIVDGLTPLSRDIKMECEGNVIGGITNFIPSYSNIKEEGSEKKVPAEADECLTSDTTLFDNVGQNYENAMKIALQEGGIKYVHIVSTEPPQLTDNKKGLKFTISKYYYNLLLEGKPVIEKDQPLENVKLGTSPKALQCQATDLKEGTKFTCTGPETIEKIEDIGDPKFDISSKTTEEVLFLNSPQIPSAVVNENGNGNGIANPYNISSSSGSGLSATGIFIIVGTAVIIIVAIIGLSFILSKKPASSGEPDYGNSVASEAHMSNY